ncbi:MAG: hypothetical protein M3Z37_05085, partial [Candidatus Eremiobacteraeota bacterium]|nr:hypothetical protein [Candidatus Eremiobacteraeota bacterium]
MIHTSEIERRLRRATRALGMPSSGGAEGGVPAAAGTEDGAAGDGDGDDDDDDPGGTAGDCAGPWPGGGGSV